MTHIEPAAGTIRPWIGLSLLALPTVLLGLDVTVLYLVLPSMALDLGPSATQTLWIMDSYGFFIAGFLITMGTLGDRIGRRRLLMIGMAAFAIVSTFAAFSASPAMLIVARSLLGIAGATLMPSTLSLISNIFPDARQRAIAIGIWAMMFALGMAAGPVVGGLLVDRFWWGAALLLANPIAIVVLVGAPRFLPEYKDAQASRLDFASVSLSLTMILPIIYVVKDIAAHGPEFHTLALLSLGLVAGFAFVRRQKSLLTPLLDLSLFKSRTFSAALTVLLIGLVSIGGSMYLVTQYLQFVSGFSPARAGLWMGPPALAMFASALGAPLISRHFRPGYVMGTTLAISVIGYVLLATAGLNNAIMVVIGFTFAYLGLGAISSIGTDMVVGAAPASRSGSAAAMSETVQELGIAVGVALLGSLTTAIYRNRISNSQAGTSDALGDFRESLSAGLAAGGNASPQVVESAQQAFVTGVNIASLVAAVAISIAMMLAFVALRHVRPLGGSEPATTESDLCNGYAGSKEYT